MEVTVRLFAKLREEAGTSSVTVSAPERVTAGEAVAMAYDAVGLASEARAMPVVLAVNLEQAGDATALSDGDEVAVLPPVSGGSGARVHADVRDDAVSGDRVQSLVADPRAGAIVLFHGVTREVDQLYYEAHEQLARKQLGALLEQVAAEHGVCALAAEHRTGVVPLGESSVVVAASAPHRPEAFAAARAAIDRIKSELPVWKREHERADGRGDWVAGTPMEWSS